ncbi:MAG: 3-phosphoshikimate 1-carboxyvinyltransferase [Ginsengibacter sp.]
MIVKINPSLISGSVTAPASKSAMQRACALALINNGKTTLSNPGKCNDDLAALQVIQDLGSLVIYEGDQIIISHKGSNSPSATLNCGESGLGLRMFSPLAALNSNQITINGTGSLLNRPMGFFDEIFPQVNVKVQSNNGKLPLVIQGPLIPEDITIDGSLSSQFLTGLMIAYACSTRKSVLIRVNNLKSKPYIDLTLELMEHFGWDVSHENYEIFHFTPSVNQRGDIHYTVEGDWSGGAFLLVAGAIAGDIEVKGLSLNSSQADKKIIDALKEAGAHLDFADNGITVFKSRLNAFAFDATDCPDLFPPLAALASFCSGTSVIKGVSRLKHKESDRGTAIVEEFTKLGVNITVNGDEMSICGVESVKPCQTSSHHDHRIAMACAVAALRADGQVVITDADAIKKSYPDFYKHLAAINCSLQII